MFNLKTFLRSEKMYPVLGLILTISLLWPLLKAPLFSHHDDIQVIRLYEMDRCIKDGQFPCRWVPDLGYLYGYPIFNYYAPLPYYFGEIFYLLTSNLILSVKVMFASAFIGAFLFMYLFARKFYGELGGSLSAIFYSFAPYHAVDFYVRGAMGEMWGLMMFPAILWALTKLEEKTKVLNFLLSGLLMAALITAHNLSAFIFFPIILLFILVLFLRKRNINFLYFSFFSLILGIILSSFYLLPMVFEKNLVHVENTTVGYFSYTEHFKGLRKLFLERTWGWGSSIREIPGGEKDTLSYQIGWVHIAGWFIALISAGLLWKKHRWNAKILFLSTVIIFISIFLIHPRSDFVWKIIEPLKYLQFPWRFLMIISFFVSFVAGSIFVTYKGKKIFLWLALVTAVVILNFNYFRPEKFLNITQQQLLSGKEWERQIKRSILDYLPIFAKVPPAELATARYKILTGDTLVLNFQEGTKWIKFQTKTKSHTIIRLSQYYFPNWRIFVDGKEIIFDYKSNDLGLMSFILGEGNHEVEARLYDTPIRSIANFISLVGLGIFILLFFANFRKVQQWILYYRRGIN